MCDYSLHMVENRPAKLGDKLVCKHFKDTFTIGFADVDAPDTAVCLSPGTELAFASEVRYGGVLGFWRRTAPRVARFCQVKTHISHAHHDALEFPDGCIVSLQELQPGQSATVLQLPSSFVHQDGSTGVEVAPALQPAELETD